MLDPEYPFSLTKEEEHYTHYKSLTWKIEMLPLMLSYCKKMLYINNITTYQKTLMDKDVSRWILYQFRKLWTQFVKKTSKKQFSIIHRSVLSKAVYSLNLKITGHLMTLNHWNSTSNCYFFQYTFQFTKYLDFFLVNNQI